MCPDRRTGETEELGRLTAQYLGLNGMARRRLARSRQSNSLRSCSKLVCQMVAVGSPSAARPSSSQRCSNGTSRLARGRVLERKLSMMGILPSQWHRTDPEYGDLGSLRPSL